MSYLSPAFKQVMLLYNCTYIGYNHGSRRAGIAKQYQVIDAISDSKRKLLL